MLNWNNDDCTFVSVGDDGYMKIWNILTGICSSFNDHNQIIWSVSCVKFKDINDYSIISGDNLGPIKIWKLI